MPLTLSGTLLGMETLVHSDIICLKVCVLFSISFFFFFFFVQILRCLPVMWRYNWKCWPNSSLVTEMFQYPFLFVLMFNYKSRGELYYTHISHRSSFSYLHSCEPPIIHGNLTCDTIFIQHNGLIKIGSGGMKHTVEYDCLNVTHFIIVADVSVSFCSGPRHH